VNRHIVDALRPELPDLDPFWEAETVRAILEDRTGSTPDRPVRRRLVSATLIAAAVAVFIGGVAVARHALPSDDVRPAKPTQDKIQRIDPSKATKLKLGDTLDVVTDLPKTYNGDQVFFSAFAGSKALVGSATQVQDESAPDAKPLMPSHPVLYELDTKTFTILDDRTRPEPTQIVDESGDADTVIWAELVGVNIGASEFTLHSYDRRTGDVTTLAEFNDPDGQIVYGNDLTLAGDTAYFSTSALPAKRGQQAVYAVPVDGAKPPSVIAKAAGDVRVTDDTLTYAVSNLKDIEAYPTFFSRDLRTGKTTRVPVSSHVDDAGFCGADVTPAWETWCVGSGGEDTEPEPARLTIKEASGRTTEFAPFPVGSGSGGPIPHDVMALGPWTAITVTTDDGQDREFLVDLDTKETKVFPDNTSFTSLSPDRSEALISSYAGKGPGPQRIVRIPES